MSIIEIEPHLAPKKKFPRLFLVVASGLAIAALGLAVGAVITINSSGQTELGGGIVQTPACDTDGVSMTPFQSYVNKESEKFTFNEIILSDISELCSGKDFIITVRDENNNKLPISVRDDGSMIDTVRIYFHNFVNADGTVSKDGYMTNMYTLVGSDSETIVIDAINGLESTGAVLPVDGDGNVDWPLGQSPATYWQLRPESNSVSIVFNPSPGVVADSIAGFADARHVYKLTLESTDHVNH